MYIFLKDSFAIPQLLDIARATNTTHSTQAKIHNIFFVMILEEQSYYYQSYSSDPGPTFLGQFNMSDLTDTQRAQLTIDMGLVEREILILSQLHVINVQRL